MGWRLGGENLGSRYDPSSAYSARADKKTPPPIPLWSPGERSARDASDRPVDYLSVCRA
jgi:hypothetical protein